MTMTNDLKKALQDVVTGGTAGAASGEGTASQLPGRTDGPADVYRHIVLGAELTRKYGEVAAGIILDNHERGLTGADTYMDDYNNITAIQLGNYVRSQGGTWADVKNLARETVQKSLVGYVPNDINPSNWFELGGGNLVSSQGNTVTLSNGLVVPSISLLKVSDWSKNPENPLGIPLSNEDSNWPDTGGAWTGGFIYEAGNKAITYTGIVIPVSGASAITWGDPHLVTCDGFQYDFQAPGEFVLSKSTTDDFEVQVRQELYGSSTNISVNTAVATKLGTEEVGIYLKPDNTASNSNNFITMDTAGTLNALNGDDTIFGTSSADTINGNGGNDIIQSSGGNDSIHGNDGDDVIVGGAGNDTINGGTGADQARFSSNFNQYTLTQNSTQYTLTNATDGTDVVSKDVEQLIFANGIYANGAFTAYASSGNTNIAQENFESGATGWSSNTTTNGGANFSTFLGRFANDNSMILKLSHGCNLRAANDGGMKLMKKKAA